MEKRVGHRFRVCLGRKRGIGQIVQDPQRLRRDKQSKVTLTVVLFTYALVRSIAAETIAFI